jgi:cell division protein FtsQ
VGYDPKMIETLPWLAGVKLTRIAGAIQPLAGMAPVADLLAKAKLEAEHLYGTWRVVSLARLESDAEIEVTTRDATKVTFGVNEDFYRQLANLDAILDAAQAHPEKSLREINLAVGAQVPVAITAAPPADAARPASPPPALPALVLPAFPSR